MISEQSELVSTRLCAESNISPSSSETPYETSSPTLPPDLVKALGGRFSADIADILWKLPKTKDTPVAQTRVINHRTVDPLIYEHQSFALARIRGKNISGAIDYIERHAPDLREWLNNQIKRLYPTFSADKPSIRQFDALPQSPAPIHDGILVDVEAARIARIIGDFKLYRAWVFAHSIDDGDGWVKRDKLEEFWKTNGAANGKRQARRLIEQGIRKDYWTYDKNRERIYLFGQVRVVKNLVSEALNRGYYYLIETNKPGKRRVRVNLSGTLNKASANLYAAWLLAKDPECKGTTISRDMLCDLWQVSKPTLLKWENIAGIRKQDNFAQSNDTSPENVPAYAYLTLNRDGSTSTAWRLPNTYYVNNGKAQPNSHTGKAIKVRQAVRVEIALAEQRGSIGDAALPRSGKRYFTDSTAHKTDAFQVCDKHLRKVSRKGGDVFKRRYFFVGSRHNARIFEPYNIKTNAPETNIYQRLIHQEHRRPIFITAMKNFAHILKDYHDYEALFS